MTVQERWNGYLLAVVEDDGAVGPAVMVDQAQVGKKTHTHSLQASLVTQSEAITLDLQRQTGTKTKHPGLCITHAALVNNVPQ